MADYFLVLDGDLFERAVRPALAAGWRQRSFGPCRDLCARLLPSARAYAERYHTGSEEPLLVTVAGGLPFDRTYWRSLVSEVLLFAAVEIPEFQTCADTLCRLLAPGACETAGLPREQLPPIRQAHEGSRDLTFGGAVYRPDHAGYNNAADVTRLADYLGGIDPARWAVADLAVSEDEDADDLADELDFTREWFPVLAALYRRCQEQGRVIVHESIY